MVKNDDRVMGMLAHLLALFTGFIGPLLFYLIKKDSKFVRENARNALNFQISLLLYGLISLILVVVLIGFLLIFIVSVFGLVMTVIGAIRANEGKVYKYPLAIPFLK